MNGRVISTAAVVLLLELQTVLACGYHAGLADARFDVVHPKSLSVAVALRKASLSNHLDVALPTESKLPTFVSKGYAIAVRQLTELRSRLAHGTARLDEDDARRFALVFVRSRLWSEYAGQGQDIALTVHTPPTTDPTPLILSDEMVLKALLEGDLSLDEAMTEGLLVITNDPNGRLERMVRAAIRTVGKETL